VAADRAKSSAQKPVYFLGGGFATTHRQISSMPDLTVTGAAQGMSHRRLPQAGSKTRSGPVSVLAMRAVTFMPILT
jgi:hypothetical protein